MTKENKNTEKQCDIHVVIPTLLVYPIPMFLNITEGKEYKLLKEDEKHYTIQDDLGNTERFYKKWLEKKKPN